MTLTPASVHFYTTLISTNSVLRKDNHREVRENQARGNKYIYQLENWNYETISIREAKVNCLQILSAIHLLWKREI